MIFGGVHHVVIYVSLSYYAGWQTMQGRKVLFSLNSNPVPLLLESYTSVTSSSLSSLTAFCPTL